MIISAQLVSYYIVNVYTLPVLPTRINSRIGIVFSLQKKRRKKSTNDPLSNFYTRVVHDIVIVVSVKTKTGIIEKKKKLREPVKTSLELFPSSSKATPFPIYPRA